VIDFEAIKRRYPRRSTDVPALVWEVERLRKLNIELTADFHRVQSELDGAEQEHDRARAEVERLKTAWLPYEDENGS